MMLVPENTPIPTDDDQETPDNDTISCPMCGNAMIARNGKFGEFYGCSTYPRCKCTLKPYQIEQLKAEQLKAKKEFKLTSEQQAMIDWVTAQVDGMSASLIVEACAGSGKTTTIMQAIKARTHGEAVYLVFNAHNRDEARLKGLPAFTTHQHGLEVIKKHARIHQWGRPRIEGGKLNFIMAEMIGNNPDTQLDKKWLKYPARRLVDWAKSNLIMKPTVDKMIIGIDDMALDIPQGKKKGELAAFAIELFGRSINDTQMVDFSDMIFYPIYHDMEFITFDWVFGDEVQDWTPAQIELMVRTRKPEGTKCVMVGDRNQSIYAWRGASATAMDIIKSEINAEELPLSITFRVPLTGVSHINLMLPYIAFNAFEKATEGTVDQISTYEFRKQAKNGDMILCRTNAPMIRHALQFIKEGRKAVILGKDIGLQLVNLIDQHKDESDGIETMLHKLATYVELQVARLNDMGKEMQAATLLDKSEAIRELSDGITYCQVLIDRIEQIFSAKAMGVTFSTVHKSKGLEADRVFILRDDLMPHPMSKQADDIQQEKNIQYVAYTRHKQELLYIQ